METKIKQDGDYYQNYMLPYYIEKYGPIAGPDRALQELKRINKEQSNLWVTEKDLKKITSRLPSQSKGSLNRLFHKNRP